jgi:hypothetical protein
MFDPRFPSVTSDPSGDLRSHRRFERRIDTALTQEGDMSPVISAVAVVLALGASAVLAADPVYKSTMPDGRVIYGESPMQGAKRIDKVAAPPEHAGIVVATPEDKGKAAAIPEPRTGVAVIPQPIRPPTKPAVQGYSANPQQGLTGRGY